MSDSGSGRLPQQDGAAAAAPSGLPASRAFDLNDPSQAVFRHRRLWCPSVMQCAGYDHLNRHWYVAQTMYLPGDGVPWATRVRDGELPGFR